MLELSRRVDAIADHLGQQVWIYIFAIFTLAMGWYASMNVLTYLNPSLFGLDLMPLIAGGVIIPVAWHAVSLRGRLLNAVGDLDDGAAVVVADSASASRDFFHRLHATISRYRNFGSALVGLLSLTGASIITYLYWIEDQSAIALRILLLVGMPFIGLCIGALLGNLLGYAQLLRVMDACGISLASMSTPQARQALRGLESVYRFAILSTTIMCLWFAGWWLFWAWGGKQYTEWRVFSLILWLVSIALLVFSGFNPALHFRRRLDDLVGGDEGRKAIVKQIKEAEADLARLNDTGLGTARLRRERREDLNRFMANLKEQEIHSLALEPSLHAGIIALNVALFVIPAMVAPHGIEVINTIWP